MAENKGGAYILGALIGTLIGFTFTATITVYVGNAVLNWLGL